MSALSSASSVTQCLSCGGTNLTQIVDLGRQPLANNLLRESDLHSPEPRFPLGLQVCQGCWLLQLTHLVPPVDLFSEYLYFSSFSEAMLRHARIAAEKHTKSFGLGPRSLVVEIASNDGYLLKNFRDASIPCLGIEPAANIAKVAREIGIETLELFFGNETAALVADSHGQADLILGNNVFAHAPEPNDFVAGLARLLKPSGRVVLEFPYAIEFIKNTEFDTVYHEHVFYFSLTALKPLFERHALELVDAELLPIHGGSLRLTARHAGAQKPAEAIARRLEEEADFGANRIDTYRAFAGRAAAIREKLRALLGKLKENGHSIAAYGASAKGSTLMNYCGIENGWLDFVADRSPYKQGLLTPGTHLPIVAPPELIARQPDYTLLLTWNFAEEIFRQQAAYIGAGGKFILPIPEPQII